MPVPKLPQTLFPVLTDAELDAVSSCRELDPKSEIGVRNRALIAFMLETGVRLSKVANLPIDALDIRSSQQNRGTRLAALAGMSKPLVPDDLWIHIAPLLPEEPPKPRGRPRIPDRACLTGIPWELLPQEMGCGAGMICWRRLRD